VAEFNNVGGRLHENGVEVHIFEGPPVNLVELTQSLLRVAGKQGKSPLNLQKRVEDALYKILLDRRGQCSKDGDDRSGQGTLRGVPPPLSTTNPVNLSSRQSISPVFAPKFSSSSSSSSSSSATFSSPPSPPSISADEAAAPQPRELHHASPIVTSTMEDKGAGGGVAEAVETPLKPIRIRGSRPTPSEASSGPPLPELPELVVQKGADDVPLLYFHSGCKSLTPPPPVNRRKLMRDSSHLSLATKTPSATSSSSGSPSFPPAPNARLVSLPVASLSQFPGGQLPKVLFPIDTPPFISYEQTLPPPIVLIPPCEEVPGDEHHPGVGGSRLATSIQTVSSDGDAFTAPSLPVVGVVKAPFFLAGGDSFSQGSDESGQSSHSPGVPGGGQSAWPATTLTPP